MGLLNDPDASRSLREVVSDPEMDIAALHNMLVKNIDREMNLLVDRKSNLGPDVSGSVFDILRGAEERSYGFALDLSFNGSAQGTMPFTVGVLLGKSCTETIAMRRAA